MFNLSFFLLVVTFYKYACTIYILYPSKDRRKRAVYHRKTYPKQNKSTSRNGAPSISSRDSFYESVISQKKIAHVKGHIVITGLT